MPTITSPANVAVKAARRLGRRRHRAQSGRFLVEGPNVLAEARPYLEQVFLAEHADADSRREAELAAAAGAERVDVSDAVMETLTATVTARGVCGVARLEEPPLERALDGATLVVLCCDVADPGNVGTIIRSADAAGADAVLLTAGSVDARNAKAVRSSAGSLFHLPVVSGLALDEVLDACRRHGFACIAADMAGTLPHAEADWRRPSLLMLGGEAHGLPGALLRECDETVRVEMYAADRRGYRGQAESLNLAATAAVVLFEAARQRAGSRASEVTR